VRTVLDSDVLVAAIRSDRGASRQLLEAALERKFPLLLSVPLIIEYEAVITRPEHLEVAGASASEIGILLDALVSLSEQVKLSFRWRPILSDPEDDMVLETAVNGSAEVLVTFNQRHFAPAAKTFELKVLTPGEALELLRSK
jgi:putative PIN family toxin of toxin-antitoxin system